LTQFEAGGVLSENLEGYLLTLLVMNYIKEPYFDDLRTQQQLGYVVHSQSKDLRNIMHCWFLVQSGVKSTEYIIRATNDFLVKHFNKLKLSFTEEEFQTRVEAIRTQIKVKDFNLSMDCNRMWAEIGGHTYNFDRQA